MRRGRTRSRGGRTRAAAGAVLTLAALCFVWFALTAPDDAADLTPGRFLRLPLEALVLVALLLVAGPRLRRGLALVTGLLLAVLVLLKLLDMAFVATLDRPFDTVVDWRYLGPLTGLVVDSVGRAAGVGVIGAVSVLVLVLLVLGPWAVLRLTRVLVSRTRVAGRGVAVLAGVWVVLAVLGTSAASTGASTYAWGQVVRVPRELHDEHAFASATVHDPLSRVPSERLLTALRGKDVLFVFVESYGRVAVQDSSFAPGVDRALEAGTRRLRSAGFASRSAFLTSPTYGGISWLAHSTLQSGLWVDSQQRYGVLLHSHRSHAEQGVPPRRLADRLRRAREHPRLAAGPVLRLRHVLRLTQRRLRRPALRLSHDARPVHARRLPAGASWRPVRGGR